LSTLDISGIIKTTKRTVMPKPRNAEHYVNNKEFLNALENYFARVEKAKLNDEPKPEIPRYIGECFLKIANHLSYKPNFVNYMFKDDMICDGIENCVRYIHNFNPEKSKNPFALTSMKSLMPMILTWVTTLIIIVLRIPFIKN
jgi:hypothetical protein